MPAAMFRFENIRGSFTDRGIEHAVRGPVETWISDVESLIASGKATVADEQE